MNNLPQQSEAELRNAIKTEVLNNARYTHKPSMHNFQDATGNPTYSYKQSLDWTVNQIMALIAVHTSQAQAVVLERVEDAKY